MIFSFHAKSLYYIFLGTQLDAKVNYFFYLTKTFLEKHYFVAF